MAFLKRSKDPFTQIQTCLQKRDYRGALVWFKPLLEKDTKNTQVRLRYADTLVLAGSKKEAIKQYRVVADELAEAGFMIRAIAISKKIVQLDPSQSDVHAKLAAMNEERSRTASAKSALPLQTTPVSSPELDVEEVAIEEPPPPVEPSPPPGEERAEPTLSLDESMAMEFGGALPEQPETTPPGEEPASLTLEEPGKDEEVVEIDLGGGEPESRGFELAVEEAQPDLGAPTFEGPSEELEIGPSAEGLGPTDDTEATREPAQEIGTPSLEDEVPSFDEESVAFSEDHEVTAEPEEDLELTLEPEIEKGVEEELELESEPEEEEEEELELEIETEPDAAANGKDPLVGLLGEDIESMIDSIIDDVGSSVSATPQPQPKAATRIPLFSDLTAAEFVDVAIMLVRRSKKAGTVIVSEGDPGDSMFIVSTGEVEATTRDEDGKTVKLATLRDGDFFGEMAVLSGEPRSATVTAVKSTELLELSRSDLNVICSRHPEVEAKLRLAYDERSMRNQ